MQNELTVINRNDNMYIDSREIAVMIGKKHAHLCRDIASYMKVIGKNPKLDSSSFFIESSYTQAGNGKEVKCYLVSRRGCDMIANKMTGEKGISFTAVYVDTFAKMQMVHTMDSYAISDPLQRAQRWIEEETKRKIMENTIREQALIIEEQAPAVEYCHQTAESEEWIDVSAAAKKLHIKGVGPKKLMSFMRSIGDVFYKKLNGRQINVPTQEGVDNGYYRLYSYSLSKNDNPHAPKTVYKPQISIRGLQHIMRMWHKHNALVPTA